MTQSDLTDDLSEVPGPISTRAALARMLRQLTAEIGADRYMIVEPSVDRGPRGFRILTSNWLYDALEDLGTEGIARILESDLAVPVGVAPRPLRVGSSKCLAAEDRQALLINGHAEMFCQRLRAGGGSVFAIFSSEHVGRIDTLALMRVQVACGYALEQFFTATGQRPSGSPLSDRERECLMWVSEGKTTDEVAVILGVSSNTVNSYVAHAIQKIGAANRAMAIATAIRSGVI